MTKTTVHNKLVWLFTLAALALLPLMTSPAFAETCNPATGSTGC